MMRRIVLAACFLAAAAPAWSRQKADAPWKAGAAKVKITPEKLMWMSGYGGRTMPAEGTLQDLWAKALVVEDPGGKRVVLVTTDLVGVPRELSVAVCAALKQKHGLPREAVLLSV